MEDKMFGMKEVYDCILTATYDIEMGGKIIKAGEPLVHFSSIQMFDLDENHKVKEARGGYGNIPRVFWEDNHEVNIGFSQGIVNRVHLAFVGNNQFKDVAINAPMFQTLELDEQLTVTLKRMPAQDSLHIYHNGEKVTEFSINDKVITFSNLLPYEEVDIYYSTICDSHTIQIGKPLIQGFLSMTAKTRIKDDVTGNIVTGIFTIPKMRLMSDFSIRLGDRVTPSLNEYRFRAFPTGSKGSMEVVNFSILNEDIDSDI